MCAFVLLQIIISLLSQYTQNRTFIFALLQAPAPNYFTYSPEAGAGETEGSLEAGAGETEGVDVTNTGGIGMSSVVSRMGSHSSVDAITSKRCVDIPYS